jgi:hypothetical protein
MTLIGFLDWAIGIILCCSVITFLAIVALNASRPLSYVSVAPKASGREETSSAGAAPPIGRAAAAH